MKRNCQGYFYKEIVRFEFIEYSMKNILINNDLELEIQLFGINTLPSE